MMEIFAQVPLKAFLFAFVKVFWKVDIRRPRNIYRAPSCPLSTTQPPKRLAGGQGGMTPSWFLQTVMH